MKTIALLTFIAVYALLLLLPKYRAVSALSAAALFLLLRIVPLGDVAGTVDWNVLMMLAGTMGDCGPVHPVQYAQPPVGPAGGGAAQRKMAHHRAGTVRGAGIRLCG